MLNLRTKLSNLQFLYVKTTSNSCIESCKSILLWDLTYIERCGGRVDKALDWSSSDHEFETRRRSEMKWMKDDGRGKEWGEYMCKLMTIWRKLEQPIIIVLDFMSLFSIYQWISYCFKFSYHLWNCGQIQQNLPVRVIKSTAISGELYSYYL